MPTVLRLGPCRFLFHAGDRDEPPHVHVERDDNLAKFWLDPVRLQRSGGFRRVEVQRIQRLSTGAGAFFQSLGYVEVPVSETVAALRIQ